MEGSNTKILGFLEGADKRFIVPVYQRKYSWKRENCLQLWNDLKKVVTDGRESHFFGSIVSSVIGRGSITEHHIIDGQQRLTTLTILLITMRDHLLGTNESQDMELADEITSRFFRIYGNSEEYPLRLRPVSEDKDTLLGLFTGGAIVVTSHPASGKTTSSFSAN